MHDDFDAVIAGRIAVLDHVPVPDIWSLVESKLLEPQATTLNEDESNVIDVDAAQRSGEHRKGRPLIVVLASVAAAAALIGALVIVDGRGDPDQPPPVDSSPLTTPATTIDTTPPTEFLDVPEDQIAVVREFVGAINAGDAGALLGVVDPEGAFDLQGGFADNADSVFGYLQQHFGEQPLVRAWMSIVDAWGLEVVLTSCRPRVAADDNGFLFKVFDGEDGFLVCDVRTRWHTLSLELGEEWQINLRGGRVTWFGQWAAPRLRDLNPQPRQLPLGYDGLEAWEAWLGQTDPDAAARLLNPRSAPGDCNAECVAWRENRRVQLSDRIWNLNEQADTGWVIDGHAFSPSNAIPYDPRWADEIRASIQDYLDEQSGPDSSVAATMGESLWVQLEPGATAPLPPAPIPERNYSAMVWTGTELIVRGGYGENPADPDLRDGAAFDPTAGTWRQIARAPDGVTVGKTVWTGTEMLVLSGYGYPVTQSAAYAPATDTWRLIADPPAPGTAVFWIGNAALLLGEPDNGANYAYDPATDDWRRLADGPWSVPAVWTGTTLLTVTDIDSNTGTSLTAYDPATDTWRVLEGLDGNNYPVVIPGLNGAAAIVAFLPLDPGQPVKLVDDRGNAIGEWASRPAELATTCATPPNNTGCLLTTLQAESVGGEVLFWYSGDGWALDVATQTWRALSLDGRKPTRDGTNVIAIGDLLFAFGAGQDGLVYRAASPG